MREFGREEYYPWYKNSSANLPKDRYLNKDFLKFEQKRIEEAHQWHDEYLKAEPGDTLDEYETYIVPIDPSKLIKKRVNGSGYKLKGSSALRNNLQAQKLALFPKDLNLPPDYSLVRIFEPKKKIIPFVGDTNSKYGFIVDDYEILPIDYIYYDLPAEEKRIFSLLKGHLGGDELMAESVYSPIISSPGTAMGAGGIGSASLTRSTRFATTLNDQVRRMLPPELADYTPPNRDIQGFDERVSKGRGRKIVYNTAEKTRETGPHVGLTKGSSYSRVQKQAQRREKFAAEYSYLGNIVPSGKRSVDVVQDALNNFTQNEITISSYDELKEADVDLTRLKNDITDYEEIWINIVDARQVMPSVDKQQVKNDGLVDDLKADWKNHLPEMGYEDSKYELAELRAEQTLENVLRLAQKFARSKRREQVTDKDIKSARRNFNDQVERLLSTDLVKDATPKIRRTHTADRESIVNTFLQSKPCTMDELVSYLLKKRKFEDESKTVEFIKRMHERGYIYKTPAGKYKST